MQRRGAVTLRRIHVDALLQERADRLEIPLPDSLNQAQVYCRGRQRRHRHDRANCYVCTSENQDPPYVLC